MAETWIVSITLTNSSIITLGDQNDHEGDPHTNPVVTDEAMFYLTLIPWTIFAQAMCIFGVISNTVNVVIFFKSGFQDSINISLFTLAISDFCSCFTLIFSTIALNPWLPKLDFTVVWDELQYIMACYPHIVFTKITSVITAFIAIERCLCVTLPLKIKTIFTRKRVIAYLITCYLVVIAIYSPIFFSNPIGMKFSARFNKTVFGVKFKENRKAIEEAIYPIQYIFLSILPFIFIAFSTGVLVMKLKEKAKWRHNATAKKGEVSTGTTKEYKISKMVIAISSLFIICFLPTAALQLAMWMDPRINMNGVFYRLNIVLAYFAFNLELMNSSANIIIYYRNSSNYRAVFNRLFLRRNNNDDEFGKSSNKQ